MAGRPVILQLSLFDQRVALADEYLGLAVFAELCGHEREAVFWAARANLVEASVRRMAGL